LDEQRRADPVLDEFLKPGHEEVFVKNLENVQGDERDVIFVSVGYGPRQPGSRLDSMNFGPVSSEGGERRLNVLFTRARRRCEVFVSFDSGDIDLTRATGAGPRVFKRFLAYAETGVLDQPIVTAADYDSAFEEDIARVIQSMGYPVDAQVGSAGFRIDLGVRDPKNLGQYLLAVECDGATYHCALWARERDRLRQEILEGLGWRFHRIWSTDWFHRREAEVARLRNALEAARDAPHVPKSDTTPPSPVAQDSILLNAPPTIDRTPYRLADFQVGLSVEPHEVSVNRMAEIAGRIVEIEGPVHADEIARRVATLFGKDRAGSRITAAVLAGLRYRIRTVSAFCEEEGFWFTADQRDACPIRERSATSISLQRADMLPPLEIRAAAVQALKENGVIKRDEIATAITRMLGFQRTGPDLRSKIDEVTAKMLADKTLRDDSGFLQEP